MFEEVLTGRIEMYIDSTIYNRCERVEVRKLRMRDTYGSKVVLLLCFKTAYLRERVDCRQVIYIY